MVNKLALELMGDIKIPSDSMIFDLQLKTKESDFFLAALIKKTIVTKAMSKNIVKIETTRSIDEYFRTN